MPEFEKKFERKQQRDPFADTVLLVIVGLIALSLIPIGIKFVNTFSLSQFLESSPLLSTMHGVLRFFLNILTLVSIAGIVYVFFRLADLRKNRIKSIISSVASPETEDQTDRRWRRIVALSNSHNPSDWKIAIIEADTILNDIVGRMGYGGSTLGEKLKNIEKSDFNTLDDAWEAHKFRNRIAHQKEDMPRREVRKILLLYEKVFKEFDYI